MNIADPKIVPPGSLAGLPVDRSVGPGIAEQEGLTPSSSHAVVTGRADVEPPVEVDGVSCHSAVVPEQLLDVDAVNPLLESRSPGEIIQWAAAEFSDGLVMSSSFGAESAVMIHLAVTVMPRIKIIMVDTGYLFPQTHRFMEELRERFDLNIRTFRTANDPIRYLAETGEADYTWRNDVDRCCGVNKNEPFDRAMNQLRPKAWLRGIRRDQADTRKSRKIVEWNRRHNSFAVSPLLPWSARQIGLYMKEHRLPYHPLVDEGYLSIGCNPLSCTRPVLPGEDPRSGRWSGQAKTECGLNVDSSLDSAKL